jgi:hypothetical protein
MHAHVMRQAAVGERQPLRLVHLDMPFQPLQHPTVKRWGKQSYITASIDE